ncbi:MAG: AI-2E family transporter [Proteobacteria bacterium]|nr:AI-2E family transporter [Pseudomonadota bacterium]
MNGIIVFLGLLFILYIGRTIFVPLILAAFIWYLINAIAAYYRKIMPFKKTAEEKLRSARRPALLRYAGTGASRVATYFFDALAMVLSIATFGGLIYAFVTQIRPMFAQLLSHMPEIQARLQTLVGYIGDSFGLPVSGNIVPNFAPMAASVGLSAAQIVTTIGLVLIYILFMFIEQSTFGRKFAALFPNQRQFGKMRYILRSIDESMKKYMFMKTLMSVVVAVASYLWLRYLGLEFAGVWAFIIFIANYIPTIGTIIATALPVLFSLLVASSLALPLLVAAGLITFQILFGNIIEPRLTGKTLNLSTLAILVNLVIWGMLWGVVGMFFSVQLLVAMFIITAQFDSTRWIAVLLSANGEIPEKEGD